MALKEPRFHNNLWILPVPSFEPRPSASQIATRDPNGNSDPAENNLKYFFSGVGYMKNNEYKIESAVWIWYCIEQKRCDITETVHCLMIYWNLKGACNINN